MEDLQRAALEEILRITNAQERQPCDIDALQYASATGLTKTAAVERLRRAERAGKLTSLLVYDPMRRRQIRVWRIVGEYNAEASA